MGTEQDTHSGNRIDSVLHDEAAGLWPFLAAGYPSLETTAGMLRAFAKLPIRGVEVGFPFSDPIADGPVIQQAFCTSLADGIRVKDIFRMVREVRQDVDYAMLAMVSASIVYRIGVARFVDEAAAAGFDGLIVPDLSLEDAPEWAKCVEDAALRLSMLIAPTTPPDREKRIAEVASGFLYYVSVQGTTGLRQALPVDLREHVIELREGTGLPVVVGFGISTPEHVRDVCNVADGAIVGSAIVRRIQDAVGAGKRSQEVVEDLLAFVRALAGG